MPNHIYKKSVIRVSDYTTVWRMIAAALFAVSRGSLPVILLLLVISVEPPVSEPLLVRLVLFFSFFPGLAAALIERAFAYDAEVRKGNLILSRHGEEIALDLSRLTAIELWRIPLPGPGVSLLTADKDRPRKYALQTDNLGGLLRELEESGKFPSVGGKEPSVVFAQARHAAGVARWYHILGKFGIFSLFPTVIFFRLHQYIMYGGAFGQYQAEGLKAYLSSFAFYWIMIGIYLLLYASIWRGLAEAVSLAAARIVPSKADSVRRWAERAVKIFYYAGVPALVGLRFLV